MDPHQAWRDLQDAVTEQNWHEAAEIADNLIHWLARGGFPPTISGHHEFDRIVARATCEALCVYC